MILRNSNLLPFYFKFDEVDFILVEKMSGEITKEAIQYAVAVHLKSDTEIVIHMDQTRFEQMWRTIESEELRYEAKTVSYFGTVKE